MLLGFKDRAELANKEYNSLTSVMEYVVIVEKAPEEIEGGGGAVTSSTPTIA